MQREAAARPSGMRAVNSQFGINSEPNMDPNYNPQTIEAKWQKRWADAKLFETEAEPGRPKYYVLEMLPYPSGDIHMGHVRNYSIGDALARYMWMASISCIRSAGMPLVCLRKTLRSSISGTRPSSPSAISTGCAGSSSA